MAFGLLMRFTHRGRARTADRLRKETARAIEESIPRTLISPHRCDFEIEFLGPGVEAYSFTFG